MLLTCDLGLIKYNLVQTLNMKKFISHFKILFFLIFFILLTKISYSQTVIIDYVFNSRYLVEKDTVSTNKSEETLFDKLNFKLLNSIKYQLVHSESKSIFFSTEKSSIFKDLEEDKSIDLNNFKISNFTSVVYKDFSKNKSLQREYILDKQFIIDDSLNVYNWTFLNEEKIINGIRCKLAKSLDVFGTNIYACFSIDFPIPNGPSIYDGLPGLIIQIESEKFSFELTSIKIIKSKTDINFNEKGEFINQVDFVELLNKKLKSFGINY